MPVFKTGQDAGARRKLHPPVRASGLKSMPHRLPTSAPYSGLTAGKMLPCFPGLNALCPARTLPVRAALLNATESGRQTFEPSFVLRRLIGAVLLPIGVRSTGLWVPPMLSFLTITTLVYL